MIHLTRLSGRELYLNADLISSVEAHPDTVVTLVDGKHYVVTESTAVVVEAITRYRATILAMADSLAGAFEEPEVEDQAPSSPGAPAAGKAATGQLYVLHGERD